MKRRDFFGGLAAAAGTGLITACNSDGPRGAMGLVKAVGRGNERLERALFSFGHRDKVARGAKITGDAFPRYWISPEVPVWDESLRGVWHLDVVGAVRKPVRLTLDDLSKLPRFSQTVNHYCVEGWTARAQFSGVRMSDLAKLVEPTNDAGYVDFQSFDKSYHESWDIDSAIHPQTLIAYATDGRYLNTVQGAPARVHSPVKLGYKNTKYLTRIVFMPTRNGGYWSDLGYEWYGGV